jgi:hypothetical protein
MVPLHDPRRGRVMLRGELLAAGYTDKAIARLVKSGEWVKVRHGAYTLAHTWSGLDPSGHHALRARAVCAQARTSLVISHASGLAFHDAPVWGIDLSDVHVTRRDGRTGRKEAGVAPHRGLILPGDVVVRDGLPVMSATRMGLEVTTIASTESSLAVMNDLLYRGLTSVEQLTNRYALMDHWPWTLGTDIVLRLADPRLESVGESRTFHLCFKAALPMPQPQYPITDPSGRVIARVDFAWPELRVFLEFDGKVKYEKLLKEGERASDVVIAEKRREERICRLTGWRCIRITWADLERPDRTASMIRNALFGR